ncbi:MAG: pyrimidine/purine nucleoside phosphorylase [Proteobacteria bacterium]|nr:pyrimidine/purine nucleoside phosphorylase [Pseudomonadota bacterium]
MSQFDQVSVIKKANVYFDDKCISHTVVCAHDVRKTIGVILPSTLTFNTGAPEVMEGVGGKCRVRLPGETEWKEFGEGELFKIPGNSAFDIEVAPGEAYHYVCHFG